MTNAANGRVVYIGCKADNLSSTTTDSDTHDYIACEITDGANSSVTNKTFINCVTPSGTKFRENGVANIQVGGYFSSSSFRLLGDQTSATNAFRVWLNGNSGHFRLHYWVVDDETAAPGAREEISGIKSFSYEISTAGVWLAFLTVAAEVTERTLNPGTAALTVAFANDADTDSDGDGYITVATTTMSGANARGIYYLEMMAQNPQGWVKSA